MRKNTVFGSFIVITFFSVYMFAATSDSHRAFLDAEAILAGWESTYTSIRTMRVSYSYVMVDFQPPKTSIDNQEEQPLIPVKYDHVERIEEGKRYHIRYSLAEDGLKNHEQIVESAFNGKATQRYHSSTRSGSIRLGQMGRYEEWKNDLKTIMFLDTSKTPDVLKDEYPNGIPQLVKWFKLGKLRGKVTVRPNLESVAGQSCHVVEIADHNSAEQIKQVFWMAHDKGMCLMKYQMHSDNRVTTEIEVEKIAMIEMDGIDIWYPEKAYRTVSTDELGTAKKELTVKEFVPNVEVDENTFRLDFPEGTKVFDTHSRKTYTWKEGMKFVFDDWDDSIKYVPEEWEILISVGKPLPKFEGIKLLSAEQTNEKAILLCFFDMDQRSSRNCLQQLSKMREEA